MHDTRHLEETPNLKLQVIVEGEKSVFAPIPLAIIIIILIFVIIYSLLKGGKGMESFIGIE